MKRWEIRYQLPDSTKYQFQQVELISQNDANKLFDADDPSVRRWGGLSVSYLDAEPAVGTSLRLRQWFQRCSKGVGTAVVGALS